MLNLSNAKPLSMLVVDFNRKKKLRQKAEVEITDTAISICTTPFKNPQSVNLADRAIRECGIEPQHKVIRGGTDGQISRERLSLLRNFFTGGYNFHSKHELITLEGMVDSVNVIVKNHRISIAMLKGILPLELMNTKPFTRLKQVRALFLAEY